MSYVNAKNLTKRFGDNTVFEDIEFSIEKGEFITLLGPSGCGKSTLLRSLAGLNPVDGGEIWVNGEEITHQVPQERGIGMVFQSYALFPNMTVEAFPCSLHSFSLRCFRQLVMRSRVAPMWRMPSG